MPPTPPPTTTSPLPASSSSSTDSSNSPPPGPPTPPLLHADLVPTSPSDSPSGVPNATNGTPTVVVEDSTTTPPTTTTAPIDSSHSDADGECFSDEWLADMRRVKVYELIGQRWTDRGTALCTGIYDEDIDQAAIVARSEVSDQELLRSEIRVNDVYQRQQETLIVWTEPDGTDYALSFQDVEGCAEIWDFILEVQRHFRGKLGDVGPSSSSSPTRGDQRAISANAIVTAGRLPEPVLGIIGEIDKAIKYIARTATGKEKICEYIVQEDYIKGLIDVMAQAEDLEALSDLHALCNLMQTILMMNDHSIYDYILQDDIYMGVIGMLEYDPDFPTYKASFREYLNNSTKYKEVVVFRDETIRKKIHQTYRLQYLKDVVLARVLDDPTFNVLNSFILFNQIDIINHIQNDEALLKDLFGRFEKTLAEGETKVAAEGKGKEKAVNGHVPAAGGESFLANLSAEDSSKRDIIILLHQLCMMGKNVQIPARLALYRSLVDKGLLFALQWALGRPAEDQQMLNAAGEILLIVCDHDASGVRSFVLKQADPAGEWEKLILSRGGGTMGYYSLAGFGAPMGDAFGMGYGMEPNHPKLISTLTTLLTVIIKVLTTSKDPALRGQMSESLKTLLELPNLEENPGKPGPNLGRKEDPMTERFLGYFFDSCIAALYKPLSDVPEWKEVSAPIYDLSKDQSSLFLYLCDNMSTFVAQHVQRSAMFLMHNTLTTRIATLLKAREKHLRLAALRFFRVCSRTNNNFLMRHMIKNEMFGPILELAWKEAKRDNLINSACQEFFEHIRKENVRLIINHIMEKHESRVRDLAKTGLMSERFQGLLNRWAQNNEPPPPSDIADKNSRSRLGRPGTGLLTAALMDAEHEDDYFNASDDEDSVPQAPLVQPTPPIAAGVKRKRSSRGGAPLTNGSPRTRSTAGTTGIVLPSPYPMKLVDYEDPEDDGSPKDKASPSSDDEASSSPASTPPLGALTRTKSSSNLFSNLGSSSGANGRKVNGTSGSPPRLSEKRRREDEEDEVFGLLSSGPTKGAKKVATPSSSPSSSKSPESSSTPPTTQSKSSSLLGGVAKKIKLSLGKSSSFGIAASTPQPKKEAEGGEAST